LPAQVCDALKSSKAHADAKAQEDKVKGGQKVGGPDGQAKQAGGPRAGQGEFGVGPDGEGGPRRRVDQALLEQGRLALGVIMYDSQRDNTRRKVSGQRVERRKLAHVNSLAGLLVCVAHALGHVSGARPKRPLACSRRTGGLPRLCVIVSGLLSDDWLLSCLVAWLIGCQAVRAAMSDYELSMNIGCFVCFGQRSAREYQPFAADPRFKHLGNDEGNDLFEVRRHWGGVVGWSGLGTPTCIPFVT
jgi:hypothetical protein